MFAEIRSILNRWSEFFGSLRTQVLAALAVGLPAADARQLGEEDAGQEHEDGAVLQRLKSRDPTHKYRRDAPGYMTRNGLGSLCHRHL